jgi:hypothetical protein
MVANQGGRHGGKVGKVGKVFLAQVFKCLIGICQRADAAE